MSFLLSLIQEIPSRQSGAKPFLQAMTTLDIFLRNEQTLVNYFKYFTVFYCIFYCLKVKIETFFIDVI